MSERGDYFIALPEHPPAAAAHFPKLSDPVVYRQLGEAMARIIAKQEAPRTASTRRPQ